MVPAPPVPLVEDSVPRRRPDRTRAAGALLLLVFASGCARHAARPFQVEALTCGEGPVGVNEPLILRFNRPLGPATSFSPRAVVVRDPRGRIVPVRVEAQGRDLVIRPEPARNAAGYLVAAWPDVPSIELQLPYPLAGAGIRSANDETISEPFRGTVRLSGERLTRPGHLQLRSPEASDGVRAFDFVSDPQHPTGVFLEFDAPIDPQTLEAGIQVIDLERREVVTDVVKRLDEQDPSRVQVLPFTGGLLLANGTRFDVRITEALRSIDGRPMFAARALPFVTRAASDAPRYIKIAFAQPSDFDKASASAASPERRLVPRPSPLLIAPPVEGSVTLTEIAPQEAPYPFSGPGSPSRTQILVPAAWLRPPEGTAEWRAPRYLITAIDFHSERLVPPDLASSDLEIALGPLSGRRVEAGLGLASRFELNDDGGRRSRVLPLRRENGLIRLAPERRDRGGHVMHLELAEPYLHDANEGDLVLSIRNLGGVFRSDAGERPPFVGREGVAILGFAPRAGANGRAGLPNAIVVGRAADADGFASPFQAYLWLSVAQIPPVVSRWYVAGGKEAPRFFRGQPRGDAVEGRDFQLYYQSGDPDFRPDGSVLTDPDGRPQCKEQGPWSPDPPVDGRRAVRVRVEFEPSLMLQRRPAWDPANRDAERRGPDDVLPLPGLDYILVGYRAL